MGLPIRFLRPSTKYERKLSLAILLYTIVVGVYTCLRHYTFATQAYDLGIFSQALWTTVREGLFFYETPDFTFSDSGSFFGVHFAPIMFLLAAIYAIVPSPYTLILLQIIIIDISTILLFKLASGVLGDEALAFWISVIFLLHPATIAGLFYDFHLEIFFPLFTFSALLYLERGNRIGFFLNTLLLLLVLDFASILVATVLILYFTVLENVTVNLGDLKISVVDKRFLLEGLLFLLVVVLPYTYVAVSVISYFGKFPFSTTSNWRFLGAGLHGIILGLLNPVKVFKSIIFDLDIKVLWLLYLLASLVFLPVLAGRSFFLGLPPIFMFILSTYPPYYQYGWQYGLIYFPLFLYAYIRGLKVVGLGQARILFWNIIGSFKRVGGDVLKDKKLVKMTVLIILLSYPIGFLYNYYAGSRSYFRGAAFAELPRLDNHVQVVHEAIKLIPRDASVLAQNDIFPHLAHRVNVYVWLPEDKLYSVDYAIADTTSFHFNLTAPGQNIKFSDLFYRLKNSGLYEVIFDYDGVIVLKRIGLLY